MEREPNTIYTLSLSYGKDSIASIEACKQLGYPIDRIIHAEIWATDDISADLPPMVEFKKKADAIIKERYGIEVEHVCATAKDGSKQTYEKLFYHVPKRRAERERERERIQGFLRYPQGCQGASVLKRGAMLRIPTSQGELVHIAQTNSDSRGNEQDSRQSQDGAQADSKRCPCIECKERTMGSHRQHTERGAENSNSILRTNSFQIGSP